MNILQPLLNPEAPEFQNAWSAFFLNPAQVQEVQGVMNTDMATELLKAGACWNGSGWNTGKASKQLYDLLGVSLITADFSQYKNSFLYALALLWSVDVPQLELCDRAGEAAFGFVALINSHQE